MWTLDRMKQVALERGETPERDKVIGAALLAHERARGRTEENYARDVAEQEFIKQLDAQSGPLPPIMASEYPGLLQLRKFAADREKLRVAVRSSAPAMVHTVPDPGKKQPAFPSVPSNAAKSTEWTYERAEDDADRG